MKIAIPMAAGRLSLHFGHCREFLLADVDEQTGRITHRDMLEPPPHQPGVLPAWLHEQGADVIIAGGMGRRARQLFAQNGIRVVIGAEALPAEELIRSYIDGTLQTGTNICDH